MTKNHIEPRADNLMEFLKRGYSLRELILKGLGLKVYSKLLSFLMYGFYSRGRGVDIDYRSVIDGARYISLADKVWIQRGAWLSVPLLVMDSVEDRPYLTIGAGTRVGPNCTISASNKIHIGSNVLLGPNVTILDHMHEYRDTTKPISMQGICGGGEVIIEDNSWLAANSVVYTSSGRIVVGRNSVVAANSVVRGDVEPYTIMSGNPAVAIKKYNPNSKKWERID